jgi:hypothetical protein
MRLRRNRIKTFYHRTRISGKDKEGSTYTEYADAFPFSGEIWSGGGKVQAEVYGEKLSYLRNVRIDGRYVITTDREGITHYVYPNGLDLVESDGLCLYTDPEETPDYKINAIKPYKQLVLEAMKL